MTANPRSSAPAKGRLPKWSELDNIWGDALTEAAKEYLQKRKGSAHPEPRQEPPVKGRSPKWSNLDDIWLKDLAEGMKEYLEERERRAALRRRRRTVNPA